MSGTDTGDERTFYLTYFSTLMNNMVFFLFTCLLFLKPPLVHLPDSLDEAEQNDELLMDVVRGSASVQTHCTGFQRTDTKGMNCCGNCFELFLTCFVWISGTFMSLDGSFLSWP